MKKLLVVSCWLLVAGCSRGDFAGVEALGSQADTTRLPPGAQIGKLKARTVILQMGQGNVATPVDNSKAGQKRGTAATGAGSTANSTQAGTPWWVFGLFVIGGTLLGFWARGKLPGLSSMLDM